MDILLKSRFLHHWSTYFPGAELPITFYYTDEEGRAPHVQANAVQRCVIGELAKVRHGRPLSFDSDTIRCGGGKRYLGFTQELRANFEYFLSCGIAGELEGERYKKTPELVSDYINQQPGFEAPGRYLVFKQWDQLDEADDPAVVVFFAPPDVLSGLFTLANFDEREAQAVIAPFGSGCASIVLYPFTELHSTSPRAVLGMFDVSARPYVPVDVLTFAVPWPKFVRMVDNVEQCFLSTTTWGKLRARIWQWFS